MFFVFAVDGNLSLINFFSHFDSYKNDMISIPLCIFLCPDLQLISERKKILVEQQETDSLCTLLETKFFAVHSRRIQLARKMLRATFQDCKKIKNLGLIQASKNYDPAASPTIKDQMKNKGIDEQIRFDREPTKKEIPKE